VACRYGQEQRLLSGGKVVATPALERGRFPKIWMNISALIDVSASIYTFKAVFTWKVQKTTLFDFYSVHISRYRVNSRDFTSNICLLLLFFMRIVPPLFLVENPHQGGLGLAFWEFLDVIVIGPVFKEPENGQSWLMMPIDLGLPFWFDCRHGTDK
jgi:hypothetical protein